MPTDNPNLFCALRAGFPADLDAVAIESADGDLAHYTWRDIDRGSAMFANLLESLELPAEARIAVQTEKSVEGLILYLGVLRAGFVYLPLNPAYQQSEIGYFIGNAEPSVVVCSSRNFGWVSKLAFTAGTAHVLTLDDDRTGSLLQRAAAQSDRHTPAVRQASDLAAILYTSGTTGVAKGAMLSHGNLLSNAQVLKDYWGWQPGDVLIHALPIFHVHGLFVASHGALLNGSKMIWLSKFDPRTVIARLPDATVFMGVPTLYVRLLREAAFDRSVCSRMRLFISGSAPLLIDVFREFRARSGHTILERYGMSETVMLTSNPYHAEDGERRGGTVGFALPGVGVRVVPVDASTDTGNVDQGADGGSAEALPTATGAIEVTGPNVFSGYWRMPEKTRDEFTPDGWFRTGDVGRFDADGYLTIVGRSKDLIISGGFNVYPAEVEGVLNELPGVAESAVIGAPHPDFGEAVVAVIIARPGASTPPEPAEMIRACKTRIANFKVPRQVFVVDELPRNAMGKVQKNMLRERYRGLFG